MSHSDLNSILCFGAEPFVGGCFGFVLEIARTVLLIPSPWFAAPFSACFAELGPVFGVYSQPPPSAQDLVLLRWVGAFQ